MTTTKFINILISSALLVFASCASVHPGNEGQSISNSNVKIPVKVSARTIDFDKKEAFQIIEITVENLSDNWVRLYKSEAVLSQDPQNKISVVLGEDLKSWAEAKKYQLEVDQYNKQLLQASLLAVGTVAAVSGENKGNNVMAGAGALAVVGTSAWVVGDSINSMLQSAEGVKAIPENHLYHPFAIPGKMFMRRWILFNKPSNTIINKLVLKFETVEGVVDFLQVDI